MAKKEFEEIRKMIVSHRVKALRGVNTESILMNWEIGQYISQKLKQNIWGSKVVTELSEFLRAKDPTLKGYSRRNLYNMVAFYDAYSSPTFTALEATQVSSKITANQIVQTKSAQLQNQIPLALFFTTFSNHVEIINNCKTDTERLFYIIYAYKENLNNRELKRVIININLRLTCE